MTAMKLCILASHPKWKDSLMIAKEAKKQFDGVFIAPIEEVSVDSQKKIRIMCGSRNLANFDCILPRIDYEHKNYGYTICRFLEKKVFIPVKSESILLTHDKFLTLTELQKAGIPIPLSYISSTKQAAEHILDKITYPAVIKLTAGKEGIGVMFAHNKGSASAIIDTIELMNSSILIEKYVENEGQDVRAFVVGDKVIGAMKRVAKKDELRANITLGGRGEKTELSDRSKEIAVNAAQALGMNIAGIDLMGKENDTVIEVNINPGVAGISKYVNPQIPKIIVSYLRKEAEKFKKR